MTSPRVAAWNLGDGETSVLSYALENPDCRAVVDDAEARRCARTLGIRTLGTGGVLVLAKQRGLASGKTIDEVLAAYPYIERQDVLDALTYAAWRAEEKELPLAS
jgi:predicted nucleic acid-binding protein